MQNSEKHHAWEKKTSFLPKKKGRKERKGYLRGQHSGKGDKRE